MREQQGEFPLLPGMYFSWIAMGIVNFLVGKLFSLFGVKGNPLELRFHYGVLDQPYETPVHTGNGYGVRKNGNGHGSWERDLARGPYPLD
jgi:hypothetical protein